MAWLPEEWAAWVKRSGGWAELLMTLAVLSIAFGCAAFVG